MLGDLKYFLGLEIARSSKGICLSQRKYTLSLLKDTRFLDSKPTSILIKLMVTKGELIVDPSLFRCMIGRLMYLTISRPDINFAVSKLSQYISDLRVPHEQALHHLLRYIKGNPG